MGVWLVAAVAAMAGMQISGMVNQNQDSGVDPSLMGQINDLQDQIDDLTDQLEERRGPGGYDPYLDQGYYSPEQLYIQHRQIEELECGGQEHVDIEGPSDSNDPGFADPNPVDLSETQGLAGTGSEAQQVADAQDASEEVTQVIPDTATVS
jgi:hypothetical protein